MLAGFLLQFIENRFICEKWYVAYSLDRRDTGAGPGSNLEVLSTQSLAINYDLVGRDKARFPGENIDAQRLKPLD